MIKEYLNVDGDFWSWDHIFDPIYVFISSPEKHALKFLEPRTDFFKKHLSQISGFAEGKE